MSAQEHMRAAFQAILNGDYAERDRLCALAEQALKNEERDAKRERLAHLMAIDFFVKPDGTVIPMTSMMPRA